MLLSDNEIMLWRLALLRADWSRKARRDRLPRHLLTQRHINGEERRTRQARLWPQQGTRVEVQALLAPIYGWFTEGVDTADLQEAKALLEVLA